MRAELATMLIAVVTAATVVAAGGPQEPAAVVVELTGSAERVSSPGGEPTELRLFERVAPGDRIQVEPDSQLVLAFFDGRRFRLGAAVSVVIETDGPRAVRGELETLSRVPTIPGIRAVPAAHSPGRRSGAIRIRSASLWQSDLDGLRPRGGEATLADQTVLRFEPQSCVDEYKLEVEDEQGQTVFAVETTAPEVVVPAGVLRPGAEYYWQVRSIGPRALAARGEALFVTLDEGDAEARARIAGVAESEGSVSALLLLAELDRSLGLHREACQELDRAAALAPENPHLHAARQSFGCEVGE